MSPRDEITLPDGRKVRRSDFEAEVRHKFEKEVRHKLLRELTAGCSDAVELGRAIALTAYFTENLPLVSQKQLAEFTGLTPGRISQVAKLYKRRVLNEFGLASEFGLPALNCENDTW